MLIFDTKKDLKEGTWCEYAPGVEVKLQPCSKADLRRLAKEIKDRNKRLPGMARKQKSVDESMIERLVFHHIIMDWRGIVDQDKQVMPCTDDNIDLLTGRLVDFTNWVLEEADGLSDDLAVIEEEEAKNSGTSHNDRQDLPVSGSGTVTTAV